MPKVFTLKFKDPDLLFEVSECFPDSNDDDDSPGEVWRRKFTRWGDYAEIQLDVEVGRFRFVPISGEPEPWPKDGADLAAQLTEARAALEEIAASETAEPAHPFARVVGRAFVATAESSFVNKSAAFAMGTDYGRKRGRFDAAEIARRALRGGK